MHTVAHHRGRVGLGLVLVQDFPVNILPRSIATTGRTLTIDRYHGSSLSQSSPIEGAINHEPLSPRGAINREPLSQVIANSHDGGL